MCRVCFFLSKNTLCLDFLRFHKSFLGFVYDQMRLIFEMILHQKKFLFLDFV